MSLALLIVSLSLEKLSFELAGAHVRLAKLLGVVTICGRPTPCSSTNLVGIRRRPKTFDAVEAVLFPFPA